jgi:hypothetical protein
LECKICGYIEENKIKFARHLQFNHKIKSIEYTIKYLYDDKQPLCPICNSKTRYISYGFKKYCKEHSNHAEIEGGGKGGKAEAWNKGLTKENDERLFIQAERQKGEGNHFYGKKHSEESLNKMMEKSILSEEEFYKRINKRNDLILLDSYKDFKKRQYSYLNFKCIKCNFIDKKTLQAFERGSRCSKCFPLNISSKPEEEICYFIKSYGIDNIIRNSRSIISPKELDIYLPEYNFAIEYNGLFWHSEERVGKYLHQEKIDLCRRKGIQLFHIFSDEWDNKKEIIKSMILHKINKSPNRIHARKCTIKEDIDQKEVKNFFENTHMAGLGYYVIKSFGLYYNNELVCCLSLKTPFRNKKYDQGIKTIEIARFSTKLYTHIMGGFNKLFSRALKWVKENGYIKFLTYSDLRFGEGNVYKQAGFEYKGKTQIAYWYTNLEQRFFRTKFKAKNNISEKIIAEQNNVFKIYGCSSAMYEMIL